MEYVHCSNSTKIMEITVGLGSLPTSAIMKPLRSMNEICNTSNSLSRDKGTGLMMPCDDSTTRLLCKAKVD